MKVEEPVHQVNRILLSPLYLLNDILGSVIPGAIQLLLLGFKGNALVRGFWFGLPFGYKTNVAVALAVSYVIGKFLILPFLPLLLLKTKNVEAQGPLAQLSPDSRGMVMGVIVEGALLATPGLEDKIAVRRASIALHAGVGLSLILSSFFPGDGNLRWVEAGLGCASLIGALILARLYNKTLAGTIGVGIANLLARMTKEQMQFFVTILNNLPKQPSSPVTTSQTASAQTRTAPAINANQP